MRFVYSGAIFRNKKNSQRYYALMLFALLFCCLFSKEKISTVFSIVLLAFYMCIVLIEKPRMVFKYIFFYFGIVANIVGCFICEFVDVYLLEISTNTHYVGALPVLALSHFVFLVCLFEHERVLSKKSSRRIKYISKHDRIDDKTLFILNCFVFLIYTLMFLHILPHPSFGYGVDRMTYSSMGYISGIWSYLAKWAQFFIPIPIGCIAYTKRKRYRFFGIATLAVYCLYYLWIGNKFGSFFSLFCVFCMLTYTRFDVKEKTLRRIFIIVVAILVALVLGAAFIFSQFQSQGTVISTYLQKRVAEQGQLFWKTYEESGGLHLAEIGREVTGQFSKVNKAEDLIGAHYGIYNIMYLCAPKQKVDGVILYGSRYTEAGYASAYYYLGLSGCILFALVMSWIVAHVTNGIIESTQKENLFGMILMTRMFFISCTALSMFLFKDYFTGTSIITYVWIIFGRRRKKYTVKNGTKKIASIRI